MHVRRKQPTTAPAAAKGAGEFDLSPTVAMSASQIREHLKDLMTGQEPSTSVPPPPRNDAGFDETLETILEDIPLPAAALVARETPRRHGLHPAVWLAVGTLSAAAITAALLVRSTRTSPAPGAVERQSAEVAAPPTAPTPAPSAVPAPAAAEASPPQPLREPDKRAPSPAKTVVRQKPPRPARAKSAWDVKPSSGWNLAPAAPDSTH
jgi:hypothetical protein